jgi:hypothetical protein
MLTGQCRFTDWNVPEAVDDGRLSIMAAGGEQALCTLLSILP